MIYTSINKKGVELIARDLASTLKSGDVLLLYGELGSGKTYFVNKLCKYLNVLTITNSPSYVLLNEYEAFVRAVPLSKIKHRLMIYHYDLYRLSTLDEVIEIGILDRINDGITIIEWPRLIEDNLPNKRIKIFFEYNKNKRNIKVEVNQ